MLSGLFITYTQLPRKFAYYF